MEEWRCQNSHRIAAASTVAATQMAKTRNSHQQNISTKGDQSPGSVGGNYSATKQVNEHHYHLVRASVAVIAVVAIIAFLIIRSRMEAAAKQVGMRAEMMLNPQSGYTDGSTWPVYLGVVNEGPAEAKNVSMHIQVTSPQVLAHAVPRAIEKPAGTTVSVSSHGHGDEYVVNIKSLVPKTAVVVEIRFQADNEATSKALIQKYKAEPFSGVFLAEFIKHLSFDGENVVGHIRAGMLDPVAEWNGFQVLRDKAP